MQSKVISLLLNAEEYRISKAKLSQRNDHYFLRVGKLCRVYEVIACNCSLFGINWGFCVTDHPSFIKVNINIYFPLRAKLWLKGGVGGQLPSRLARLLVFYFRSLRSISLLAGSSWGTVRSLVTQKPPLILFPFIVGVVMQNHCYPYLSWLSGVFMCR